MEEDSSSIAADIAAAWQCLSNLHQVGSAIRALKCHLSCQRQAEASASDASRTDQSPKHDIQTPSHAGRQASCREATSCTTPPLITQQQPRHALAESSSTGQLPGPCSLPTPYQGASITTPAPNTSQANLGTALAAVAAASSAEDSVGYDFSPASSASTSLGMNTPPDWSASHAYLGRSLARDDNMGSSTRSQLHRSTLDSNLGQSLIQQAASTAVQGRADTWDTCPQADMLQHMQQAAVSPGEQVHCGGAQILDVQQGHSRTHAASASHSTPTGPGPSAWFISEPATSSKQLPVHSTGESAASLRPCISSSGVLPVFGQRPVSQQGSTSSLEQEMAWANPQLRTETSQAELAHLLAGDPGSAFQLPQDLATDAGYRSAAQGPSAEMRPNARRAETACRVQGPQAATTQPLSQQQQQGDAASAVSEVAEASLQVLRGKQSVGARMVTAAGAEQLLLQQEGAANITVIHDVGRHVPAPDTGYLSAFASRSASTEGSGTRLASPQSSSCASVQGNIQHARLYQQHEAESAAQPAAPSAFFGAAHGAARGQQQQQAGAEVSGSTAQMGYYAQSGSRQRLYVPVTVVDVHQQDADSSNGSCSSSDTSESGWETIGDVGAASDCELQDNGSGQLHTVLQHMASVPVLQQQQGQQQQGRMGNMQGVLHHRRVHGWTESGQQHQQVLHHNTDLGLQHMAPADARPLPEQQQQHQQHAYPITTQASALSQLPSRPMGLVKLLRPQPPPQQKEPTEHQQHCHTWRGDRLAATGSSSSSSNGQDYVASTAPDSTVLRVFPAAPATSRLRMHLSSLAQASHDATSTPQPASASQSVYHSKDVMPPTGMGSTWQGDINTAGDMKPAQQAVNSASSISGATASWAAGAEAGYAPAAWAAGAVHNVDMHPARATPSVYTAQGALGSEAVASGYHATQSRRQVSASAAAGVPGPLPALSTGQAPSSSFTAARGQPLGGDAALSGAVPSVDSDQMFRAIKQQLAKLQQHFAVSPEMDA